MSVNIKFKTKYSYDDVSFIHCAVYIPKLVLFHMGSIRRGSFLFIWKLVVKFMSKHDLFPSFSHPIQVCQQHQRFLHSLTLLRSIQPTIEPAKRVEGIGKRTRCVWICVSIKHGKSIKFAQINLTLTLDNANGITCTSVIYKLFFHCL